VRIIIIYYNDLVQRLHVIQIEAHGTRVKRVVKK